MMGLPSKLTTRLLAPGSANLLFSPDGQRLAYRARQDNRPRFVVDGEEFPYAGIQMDIVFSPDSQHVAFAAGNLNDEWFMVLDGVESQKFDAVSSFAFSPDSQRFAYEGRRREAWYVIDDGVESDPLDDSTLDTYSARTASTSRTMRKDLDSCPLTWMEWHSKPISGPSSLCSARTVSG